MGGSNTPHRLNRGVYMTIKEAINYIDTVKPNNYSQNDKILWLSRLDGKVKEEIIETHDSDLTVNFSGYDENTPIITELLVTHPYDELYPMWLEAQIDYANSEYTKYNNSMSMFNTAYSNYERYYNRTHMPKGKEFKFF